MSVAWPDVSTLGLNLWQYLPQIANVAYTSTNTNTGNVPMTISAVITTPVRIRERQASFGVYKMWETTFKIDPIVWAFATVVVLPAGYPKPRDTLTDAAGNLWRVSKAMANVDQGSPYRLLCNRLVIESTLCDKISIKKPVDSTDNYLSPLTAQGTPSGPETDMPCRIQLDRQDTENFQGIQFQRNYYRCYVAALDDNLNIGCVVTATQGQYNGTTFRVVSNDDIEELEALEMLTLTIDPVA